ncbi:glycoside hydrolase family 16 protein [Mycena belliarum]|uniref:Glycoside hydrolase family 16 protein n=1 Tax=Mycena belliarum TaxID=1033014 RepID=A0AAD6U549_9AGAR|nr:glycoside hydrolase family 16 protein [Mycena belliae]
MQLGRYRFDQMSYHMTVSFCVFNSSMFPAMHISSVLALTFFLWVNLCGASEHSSRADARCQPLQARFSDAPSSFNSYFTPISPEGSYSVTDAGLEMYLFKPDGRVTKSAGANDRLGNGATINSTFTLSAGKVTIQMSAPTVAGVITAAILIGDSSSDEIDVELVCGEPNSWQTNLFVPDPRNAKPEYGVFSSKEGVNNIAALHAYSIDVSAERIVWSLDGRVVRTLPKDQCTKNGFSHFPTHTMRVQLGIWDASSPAGTAAWGKGPIDWSRAPDRVTAVVKSITVECD